MMYISNIRSNVCQDSSQWCWCSVDSRYRIESVRRAFLIAPQLHSFGAHAKGIRTSTEDVVSLLRQLLKQALLLDEARVLESHGMIVARLDKSGFVPSVHVGFTYDGDWCSCRQHVVECAKCISQVCECGALC